MSYWQQKKGSILFLAAVLGWTIFLVVCAITSTPEEGSFLGDDTDAWGTIITCIMFVAVMSQLHYIYIVAKYKIWPYVNPGFKKDHRMDFKIHPDGRVTQTGSYDTYFNEHNAVAIVFFCLSFVFATVYSIYAFPVRLVWNTVNLFRRVTYTEIIHGDETISLD